MRSLPLERVVIVEDDEGDYVLTAKSLAASFGTGVPVWADSFEAGLQSIQRRAGDVYLVDQGLGARSGIELIVQARALGSDAAMIMLTGAEDVETDVAAMAAGANDYISKQELNPRLLERSIRYALERRSAQAELLAAKRRYEAAVLGSNDGIWDWDLRTGKAFYSDRWAAMLGLVPDQLNGNENDWLGRLHPSDAPRVRASFQDHIHGISDLFSVECRVKHENGTWRWMFVRGLVQRDGRGFPLRIAGSQTDVTERTQREEEVRHRALHDELTGLGNRRLLFASVEEAMARARRSPTFSAAVVYLDLDGFKPINDLHGHRCGDEVLRRVAARLRHAVRPSDTVTRVGGDEFVIVATGYSANQGAPSLLERLRRVVNSRVVVGSSNIKVDVSIGVAFIDANTTSADEVISGADRQMYNDKEAGRSGARPRIKAA